MFWKKYTWYKVADKDAEIALNPNGIGTLEIEGKKICVAKFRNEWFAFAYNCPHAGGLMNEGYLDDSGNVVCPIHAYKFNLKNGYCKFPEGSRIKTYKMENREDGLYLGIEEKKLF
ncbi:MAG TPA: Rieske 2Fe-2S domain-containing protein [Puia sp.]|nr:Rieske 2Fe-2S domain-containing protein [Puia sp.]